MAYGDVGALLPAETLYTKPGAYREAARAEAAKRADYLSRMDMYYEELARTKEQFEKTYELQREQLELEREQFKETLGLERFKAYSGLALGAGQLDVQRQMARTQRMALPQSQWGSAPTFSAWEESEKRREGGGVEEEWFKEQVEYASGAKAASPTTFRATFPGAGTAVYSPGGELMVAGGSEASYDEELRKKYATGVF